MAVRAALLRSLLLSSCALALAGAAAAAEDSAPAITVVGTGSISARPDTAEVSGGVVTQAPTAAQALAANTAAVEKVLQAVAGLGIEERDVQTSSVSVSPLRRQGRQEPQPHEIVGYEVSNQVRIKVRDLSRVGRVLDTLVGQGANVLGGISFGIADPSPLLDQARAKAIADARHKAEVYAGAGGVRVGNIISISESGAPVPRFESARVMAAAAPVPIAPGEQDLQVSITVKFALR